MLSIACRRAEVEAFPGHAWATGQHDPIAEGRLIVCQRVQRRYGACATGVSGSAGALCWVWLLVSEVAAARSARTWRRRCTTASETAEDAIMAAAAIHGRLRR